LEQQTSLELTEVLINGLQAWYKDVLFPQEPSSQPQWIDDQKAIGWHGLVDGWLALSWRLEQEWYWAQICTQKLSKQWTLELIKKLLDVAWDLWGQRNEALHSEPENQSILESQVNDQIQIVYEMGSMVLPWDALSLLQEPFDLQLPKPLTTKQLWLDLFQAARECKSQHDHGYMMGEQQIMQCFLGLE